MSSKPVTLRLISTNRPQNLIIGPLSYAHILETETGATTSFFGVAHTLSDAGKLWQPLNRLGMPAADHCMYCLQARGTR